MENRMMGSYIRNDESFNFIFKTNLTAYEKVKFVKTVCNTLIDDDYSFIIKDMIFDYVIISIFTDFDTNEIEESHNVIDNIEKLLNETNIVDIVKENAEYGLIEELNKAVDLNIEYRTGIHKNDLNNLINTIEKKIVDINLDSDTLEMIQKFADMAEDFTPENIVKAYTQTDIFKNNLNELKESKERREMFVDEVSKVINITDKKDDK